MSAKTLTLQQSADRLGVHYMTAYRYVRTGRLPARQAGGQWRVDPADLQRVLATAGTPGRLGGQRTAGTRRASRRRLVDRLVAGDEPGAWTIVEDALAQGATAEEVVIDAVGAALRVIGERWERGELTVDDEHCASAVVSRLIARLGAFSARRGPKRGTVVIGTPPRERHALPTALATNVLRSRGFDVVDLGADVPIDAFAGAVAKADRPLAGAIGVTVGNHDRDLRSMVRAIGERAPDVPVLVGGAAIASAAHAARVGARWAGTDARSLVATIEAW